MHRKHVLGSFFQQFSTLAFLLYVLASQCALVSSHKIQFTSTTRPPNKFTTPKDSAQNIAAIKSELVDLLTFGANFEKMKLTKSMLNSTLIQKMEKELAVLQSITQTVLQNYMFNLKPRQHISSSVECASEYSSGKAELLKEIEVLSTECKDTVDNVDILNFPSNVGDQAKIIIHGCSQRTKTLPLDVVTLLNKVFYTSYLCTIQSIMIALEDLTSSKILEYVDQHSMLLLKELEYLLKDPDENRTGFYDWNLFNGYKMDFAKIQHVVETNVTKNAIRNFSREVDSLMEHYQTLKQHEDGQKRGGFLHLAKSLKDDLLEPHLKIPDLKDDPIENWVMSSGINKVIIMNSLLRELVTKVSMAKPKSRAIRGAQQDLTEAELFTEVSTTLGKPCENSPNHLVGTCTPENHEICRNVLVSWGGDEEQNPLFVEELNLLPNMDVKHCVCGFRTDCYKVQEKRRSACFLGPNKEGQCRGGLGYPCKSFPLEYGKFDESCLSGYCNWKTNSCEEKTANGFGKTAAIEDVPVGWKKVNRIKTTVKKKMKILMKLFG